MDVFAALAIGSVMPDMHYFLPVLREHWPLPSHHLISLPLFCLPAGWLLWRLWRPLWAPLSIVDGHEPPAAALWRVMLALIVGAISHLAWDACTHANYGLGLYLPMLGEPVFRVDHAAISAANLLQYGSSVAGLLALVKVAWPARRRFVHGMRAGVAVNWLVAALLVAAILTALLTFALTWNMDENVNQLRHTIRLTAWNGLSTPLLIVMLYPLLWRLRQRSAIHTRDQLP